MIRPLLTFAMDAVEMVFTDDPHFEPVNPEWMGIKVLFAAFAIGFAIIGMLTWCGL